MKRFTTVVITFLAIVIFTIPVMAGQKTENYRYISSGQFEIKIKEVRDTRGTLGYKSYDDWRYKSTDGNRYKIKVDYNGSSFHNCKVDPFLDEVTARREGDWSWTKIRVEAIDRMQPWSYRLRVKYTKVR
ncbi:MAG: hypothetical protein DRO67_07505 [Candidatus Asgardarchaeum californiense]|nr:MAG: hypothetical protein DRO67_07505 [Candidatus Asgardarchaeum californiense]